MHNCKCSYDKDYYYYKLSVQVQAVGIILMHFCVFTKFEILVIVFEYNILNIINFLTAKFCRCHYPENVSNYVWKLGQNRKFEFKILVVTLQCNS